MSKLKKPSMARKDQAPYEVGYGKPPSDKQFKKGQSGNPKGRPKGSRNKKPSDLAKNLTDVILAEACRGLPIREGDTQITIPAMQAVDQINGGEERAGPCAFSTAFYRPGSNC